MERERIRISKAGNLTSKSRTYGFTLLELVVVVVIISTFLALAVPLFRLNPWMSNPLHEARSFGQWITSLKARAVRENADIFLHIETGTNRVWVADSPVNDPAEEALSDESPNFSDNLIITGVELASDLRWNGAGSASVRIIRLSRHGYCDAAVLHLSAGNMPISLKIESFGPQVRIIPETVSFDDCQHAL